MEQDVQPTADMPSNENMNNGGEENREVTGTRKSTRGFASMDPSKQREIARKGGKAAHEKGTAHEFTPDEARAAGRKGGEAVSRDRAHMAQIGREGGQARGARARRLQQQSEGGTVSPIRPESRDRNSDAARSEDRTGT